MNSSRSSGLQSMILSSFQNSGLIVLILSPPVPLHKIEDLLGPGVRATVDLRAGESHRKEAAIVGGLVLPRVVHDLLVAGMELLAVAFDQERPGGLGVVDRPIRPIDAPLELRNQKQAGGFI